MEPKLSKEQLAWALEHREEVLQMVNEAAECETLYGFVKHAWPHLEPATKFVDGWPIRAICDCLEAVTRGQIKRLLINVPPGCMKSLLTEVFWPCWEWGPKKKPHVRYISASYDKGLVIRDLIRSRDLINSEWYRARWPVAFKDDQNMKTYYQNAVQGWRLATSVGGSLTGYRGDRLIIDDPHDVKRAESELMREEAIRWFTETLPTRLNHQDDSVMVVVMQRLHERDISGVIIKDLGPEWVKLILPMEFEVDTKCRIEAIGWEDPRKEEGELLWPERFSAASVETLKTTFRAQGGTYAEAAQLQQRPAPRGGAMFKRDHFVMVDSPPPQLSGRIVRAWDLAASVERGSAFTVGLKMQLYMGRLYILDVLRKRATPGEVELMIRNAAVMDGNRVSISIPQDPGQAGKAQKARLAALLHGFHVHFSPETGTKDDRAIPLAAQNEAGNVCLVRAAWNDVFLSEAASFPVGQYKDQIDAASRAYSFILNVRVPGISLEPGKVIT